jgi:hypothetical protein
MGIVKHDLSEDLGYYAAKFPRSGRDSMACGPVLGCEDFCGYLEMCVSERLKRMLPCAEELPSYYESACVGTWKSK